MMNTFAEFARDYQGTPLRFWTTILRDCWRSLVREHMDAWSAHLRGPSLHWVAACTVGTAASGIGVLLLMLAYSYVSPPTVDGSGVAHNRPQDLPVWAFGATIGLMLGAMQALALKTTRRRRWTWIAATSLAGAVGLPVGLTIARLLHGPMMVGYLAGVIVIGAVTGLMQALTLGFQRSAVGLVLWNAVAVPAGIFATIAVTTPLVGSHDPRSLVEMVTMFALIPLVPGAVIGMLTVASIMRVAPRPELD
jgi:hypothetical protein